MAYHSNPNPIALHQLTYPIPFPIRPDLKKYQIKLGDKPLCAFIIQDNVVDKELVDKCWSDLLGAGEYREHEDFQLEHKPEHKWLPGSNPILNYRGNAIRRTKMWFSFNSPRYLEYLYTGYQKQIGLVQQNGDSVDSLLKLKNTLETTINKNCKLPSFNHAIATKYANESDGIGMHSDKAACIHTASVIVVVRFGCERDWRIASLDDVENVVRTVKHGDIIIMGAGATNAIVKHGVPELKYKCSVSGSLVFRHILCEKSMEAMREAASKAKADKEKRKRKKIAAARAERKKAKK